METKTIGISSIISAGLISLIFIVPTFFDEPVYFCESREEIGVVHCDSFSKYVADNGKCIRDDNTNLICREGWVEVVDDRVEIPEGVEELPEFREYPAQAEYICSDICKIV